MTVMFRGKPACECLAEWLPVFEAELIRRGVVRESIDIAQLIGGAEESAGTHSEGGAWDIWQHDPVTQMVGREMGAATFNRVTGSFANNKHTHGVLNGCPHNGPARYQITALAAGYDGLGRGGYGGRDTGPGPQHLRTWREGIAWAKTLQEEDMSQHAEQLDRIEKKVDRSIEIARDQRQRTLKQTQRIVKRLNELIASTSDDATKRDLRAAVADITAEVDELAADLAADDAQA